jgi:hypothetical protein
VRCRAKPESEESEDRTNTYQDSTIHVEDESQVFWTVFIHCVTPNPKRKLLVWLGRLLPSVYKLGMTRALWRCHGPLFRSSAQLPTAWTDFLVSALYQPLALRLQSTEVLAVLKTFILSHLLPFALPSCHSSSILTLTVSSG